VSQQIKNATPVRSSTKKYRTAIGAPQLPHLPRNISHVTSGMFRNHGMEYLQCGQCEGGEMTL
jgi:hypothetical protein